MESIRLSLSLILSTDLVRITFADDNHPLCVWPFSNFSRGHEVLNNEKTAKLIGPSFTHGFSQCTSSFVLSESSSVNIPISSEFSNDFTISAFLYAERETGELLHFRDDSGVTVFVLLAMNGELVLHMGHIYCGSKQVSLSNTIRNRQWVQVIVALGGSIKLRSSFNALEKVECGSSSEESWPSGDLEIGGAGDYDGVGEFKGRVCCLVLYRGTDTSEYMGAAERDCANRAGWSYKGPRPCELSPCQHGGSCKEEVLPQYTCACVSGYTGHHCQTDVNDCEPNPCHHQQPCSDEVNGFTCLCEPDFTGSLCEIEVARTYDDGHYRLESVASGPDPSKSLFTHPVRSQVGCGQTCVSVPGCRAFTLEPANSPGWMTCTLYTGVYKTFASSPHITYYIPKYYTGPLK